MNSVHRKEKSCCGFPKTWVWFINFNYHGVFSLLIHNLVILFYSASFAKCATHETYGAKNCVLETLTGIEVAA